MDSTSQPNRKNWKRNRLIMLGLLGAPVMMFIGWMVWLDFTKKPVDLSSRMTEEERQAQIADKCGWGGCKTDEEKQQEKIEKCVGKYRPSGGTSTDNATLVQCKLDAGIFVTIEEAIDLIGEPLGKCWIDDATANYSWDNGPNHSLVQISARGHLITGIDQGRVDNRDDRYGHKFQLERMLEGDCERKDPK